MSMNTKNDSGYVAAQRVLPRRGFLIKSVGALGTGLVVSNHSNGGTMTPSHEQCCLAFGIITDLHYADKNMAINRYYRESDEKLRACIDTFNDLKPAFIIELGDFIDKAERQVEIGYLEALDSIYRMFDGSRYYVLGNHDVATFSKEDFMQFSGAEKAHYSFDSGEYHFIVLDANYNADGTDYNAGNFDWTETYIPEPQQKWLKNDLDAAGNTQSFIFTHQNLHDEHNPHGVKNAPEVRRIIEEAGNVRMVFQGHDHAGGFATVNGIPYVTFRAAVDGSTLENNAYAMVYILKDGSIFIKGYGKQECIKV